MCQNCNNVAEFGIRDFVQQDGGTYFISTIEVRDDFASFFFGKTRGNLTHETAVMFLPGFETNDWTEFSDECLRRGMPEDIDKHYTCYTNSLDAGAGHFATIAAIKAGTLELNAATAYRFNDI